MIYIALTY